MIKFICPKTNIVLLIFSNGDIRREYDNKLLTKHLDKNGYQYITLKSTPNRVNYKVHRLVCLLRTNTDNLPCVNHLDGNKQNNHINNLEWCNHSQNMRHAVKNGLSFNSSLKGENHNRAKYSFKDISEIRNRYKQGNISMRKLADMYNCSVGYISDVVNNKIRVFC